MFTDKVTDHGSSTASGVATNLFLLAGLIVTAASGATVNCGTLDWIDATVAIGASITYPVTVTVGAAMDGTETIWERRQGRRGRPEPDHNRYHHLLLG